MPDTPLNPDMLANLRLLADRATEEVRHAVIEPDILHKLLDLAVAQPEVNSAVEAFINERPGYITALKNTRGADDQSDYWRWQGHAESRRQLAQSLGWTVPHNTSETTCPAVNDV